ncbi:tRNA (uridine-5-oxyacetic acid methyl ester) 34 synthase [hydrothermal vent metagenome]|uniref:tRNA (Uridine-5-oxyacetic acid methyl ester) 34 synthase n=1 Tax=hydrothermal vent metagenome TaxID=652676 RepID=A0A1W1EIM3_9ZZZZ
MKTEVQKDNIFTTKKDKKFEFDESVASVFDDMLSRSVPFYEQNSDLIISIILQRQKDGVKVLDLGSSTAKFLLELNSRKSVNLILKGIDNSQAMLNRAKAKCEAFGADIELCYGDILTYPYQNEDIIVANYTIQFIRPMQRIKLIEKIAKSLNDDGIFIFSEKVVFDDVVLDKDIIDIYYEYKSSQGYSQYEISQKREALENILIPFTIKENIKMCLDGGFKSVNTLFQWGNFVTFIAKV